MTAGHAAELAGRGFRVFPCRPGDKRPAVPDWEGRACADPERVARFWPSPQHNVGIACGPSRLVVLDLDTHGTLPDDWQLPGITDGRDVLAQLADWADQPWPSTYWILTPSGGWHLYFTAPAGSTIRNSAGKIGPLVDVRAAGGYVVGAGSVVDCKPYEVLDPSPVTPLPRWLARLLNPQPSSPRATSGRSAPARLAGLVQAVETAAHGQRNSTLHWAACRAAEMVASGEADQTTVTDVLAAAAARTGLPEREAQRTIGSGMKGSAR